MGIGPKKRLPYLDSVAYIINQAAQIQQISAKSDSRDVRHAEQFYAAGVLRDFFQNLAINRANYRHSWTYSFVTENLYLSRFMTKPTKWNVRPGKTQISLGIRLVWSESSLWAWIKLGSLATHWVHSKDWSESLLGTHAICWFCHEAGTFFGKSF